MAATLGVVQWNLQQDQGRRFERELLRARANISSRLEQRYLLLETLAHTQEMSPSLRLIMNRTDRPTLENFLSDIRRESRVDMVVLTGLQGQSLAAIGYSQESASDWEGVKFALEGEQVVDYWLLPQGLHQVYSIPFTSGGLVDGTISMGILIDDGFLRSAAEETGVEILLRSDNKILARSFDFDESAEIDLSDATTVELGGRKFRYRTLALEGSSGSELLLLDDVSPSALLLQETRNQLLLIGGLTFLLALAFSWPLVDRVTVSSELLETVVKTVGEGLCQLDEKGIIVMVNPEGENLFGLSQQQMIGKPFDELVTVEPGPLELGDEIRLEDVVVKTINAQFPASLVASPFHSDSGQNGTVLIVRDISHAKETEEKLRQAARAKADFLAHMSHEIRTPMNGVLGMNSLLLKSPLNETQARYAQIMESSGRALLEIIDDVLEHSKLEAGAVRLEIVEFDLWEMMEDVASLLAVRAHDKGIELFLTIDCETPTKLCCDPSRLRQVLINLLGNAIKFTTSGHVRLSVSPMEDKLRFEVQDTGIGIQEEVREQLFKDFAQAESSTNRLFGGTGLGLSISERLVTLLGSRIQLASKPGEGSRFWFELDRNGAPSENVEPLGPGQVGVFINADERRETLKSLLGSWMVEIQDKAEVNIIEADKVAQFPDKSRTVVLAKPGEEIKGTHCCPLPLRTRVLYSALKLALAGESPRVSAASEAENSHQISPTAPLIMVVDDNTINREVAVASLAQLGYRSRAVASGQSALKCFSETQIDAFLMDCEMPEMDGYETSLRIRQIDPLIPIIALTAGVKAEGHKKIEASGMNSLLLKPFRLEELKDSLHSVGLIVDSGEDETKESSLADQPLNLVLNHEKLEFLRSLREDNPNFVRELIDGYLERFEKMVHDLEEAKAQQRWDDVATQAHKQRGAAGNLGLEKLRTACQTLEEQADSQVFLDFMEAASEARSALQDYLEKSDNSVS